MNIKFKNGSSIETIYSQEIKRSIDKELPNLTRIREKYGLPDIRYAVFNLEELSKLWELIGESND